jgi:hypothetical protein
MIDWLAQQADDRLDDWPRRDRELFREQLQDAASDLQRELLLRALLAGHAIAELHAFSDELRPMSDEEALLACTVDAEVVASLGFAQQLQVESDPLAAFLANGNRLSPRAVGATRTSERKTGAFRLPVSMMTQPPPLIQPKGKRKLDAESSQARGRRLDPDDLGGSAESDGTSVSAVVGRVAEDLFNRAVRSLGIAYREEAVDGPMLKLEKAVEAAHAALMRGFPVPIILGPSVGDFRRYALLLQVSNSGQTRAFQIHVPTSAETVWVNEGDLLARSELPLADKALRRITSIALPRAEAMP